ncbi:MAG: hypothetical protein M3H12_05605 [Chromatiales bacterium]|nr:hypothetical protein [Gammaproteobacteria bacterium]
MARQTSLRAAGKRYQQTYRGRLMHAERQRRYRSKVKKVTHRGSPKTTANDPLPPDSDAPALKGEPEQIVRCHFCERECGPFLRRLTLQRSPATRRSERLPRYLLPGVRAQAP